MTEMIERVARALCKESGTDPDDVPESPYEEAWWQFFITDARAAIEAMREPTEAMIAAGDDCPIVNYDGNDSKQVWQSMFDAAMSESDPTKRSRG